MNMLLEWDILLYRQETKDIDFLDALLDSYDLFV